MARSDTGQWKTALEGFAEGSFEADGKRRTVYRAGSGPAVIVIRETPTRAALDQTLTFFREKLGVGHGPGPRRDP